MFVWPEMEEYSRNEPSRDQSANSTRRRARITCSTERAPGITVLTAGCFYCNPKGNVHGPAIAHEDTVVIEIYDGPHYPQKPSWYTDERDAH